MQDRAVVLPQVLAWIRTGDGWEWSYQKCQARNNVQKEELDLLSTQKVDSRAGATSLLRHAPLTLVVRPSTLCAEGTDPIRAGSRVFFTLQVVLRVSGLLVTAHARHDEVIETELRKERVNRDQKLSGKNAPSTLCVLHENAIELTMS